MRPNCQLNMKLRENATFGAHKPKIHTSFMVHSSLHHIVGVFRQRLCQILIGHFCFCWPQKINTKCPPQSGHCFCFFSLCSSFVLHFPLFYGSPPSPLLHLLIIGMKGEFWQHTKLGNNTSNLLCHGWPQSLVCLHPFITLENNALRAFVPKDHLITKLHHQQGKPKTLFSAITPPPALHLLHL